MATAYRLCETITNPTNSPKSVEAPKLPPGNFLLVNSVAPGLPFSEAGWVAQPANRAGSGLRAS